MSIFDPLPSRGTVLNMIGVQLVAISDGPGGPRETAERTLMQAGMTLTQITVAKEMQQGGKLYDNSWLVDDDRFTLEQLLVLSSDAQNALANSDVFGGVPLAIDTVPGALGVLAQLGGYTALSGGTCFSDFVLAQWTIAGNSGVGTTVELPKDQVSVVTSRGSDLTLVDDGNGHAAIHTAVGGNFIADVQISFTSTLTVATMARWVRVNFNAQLLQGNLGITDMVPLLGNVGFTGMSARCSFGYLPPGTVFAQGCQWTLLTGDADDTYDLTGYMSVYRAS